MDDPSDELIVLVVVVVVPVADGFGLERGVIVDEGLASGISSPPSVVVPLPSWASLANLAFADWVPLLPTLYHDLLLGPE